MQSFLGVLRLVVLAGLLAACGSATPVATTGPLQPVRINVSANSGAHAPIWYAIEKGIFQKYGLQPELISLPGGAAETLAALLRGDIDFSAGTAGGAINGVLAGEERIIIASLYNDPMYNLVVGPDIQTGADLIGKSIAVTRLGSIRHRASIVALESLGIDPSQVNFVPFREGDEALMAAAIEGGSVSAAVLAPPLIKAYRDLGLHTLVDLTDLDVSFVRLSIGTLRSYVAEHRDVSLGTLQALIEAIAVMKTDRAGSLEVMAKYTGLDPVADADDLAAMYEVFILNHVQADLYPSEAALALSRDLEAADNPEAANVTFEQFVDLSLLDEIHASGFMDTLPTR